MEYDLVFGIGNSGKMIMIFGDKVRCTLNQAEFICLLLGPIVEPALVDGDYFCYDFYKGE